MLVNEVGGYDGVRTSCDPVRVAGAGIDFDPDEAVAEFAPQRSMKL